MFRKKSGRFTCGTGNGNTRIANDAVAVDFPTPPFPLVIITTVDIYTSPSLIQVYKQKNAE